MEPSTVATADWDYFRRQMPIARQWAYFDHAAVAPLSGPAHECLAQWATDATTNGSAHYPAWTRQVEHLRTLAADMIGAAPEEIALVGNTTAGINLVAEGFPWKPGDNVVIREDEFPSNQYPWLHLADRGVETRRIPTSGGRLDLDRLAAACDHRTRIVSLSWVAYASGWRHDLDQLAELVHARGALLFLDAIQGLGVFPLDVRATPVDFLAADGHKWLLGPEGAGIFFTRREHLNLLRPVGVGWNSVRHQHDFSRIELVFKDTAARYEGGSQNVAGLSALGASLELLNRFGREAIAATRGGDYRLGLPAAGGDRGRDPQRPDARPSQRHRELRVARPRSAGRAAAVPRAEGIVELPGGPIADQPARLQQRRRRGAADRGAAGACLTCNGKLDCVILRV